jgi:hypothetical protein
MTGPARVHLITPHSPTMVSVSSPAGAMLCIMTGPYAESHARAFCVMMDILLETERRMETGRRYMPSVAVELLRSRFWELNR